MIRRNLKIRFIEPGNRPYRRSVWNWFIYDRTIRTPSNGMLILATILKSSYEDVLCYSESISRIEWEDVLDADLVCISMFSYAAERGYELADYIHDHSEAKVIIGGLHATLCPEEAAEHADYVLCGEGDESLPELIREIAEGAPIDVPGVVYLDGANVVRCAEARTPVDIETIPDRGLLYGFQKATRYPTIWPQVHASRGCPFHCDYCALVAAFGSGFRGRSPKTVVEDIRDAIDFFGKNSLLPLRVLWLTDDNFFADRIWAKRVLQAMIDSQIKYRFTIQARYEVGFDDEMLSLLKEAGFIELAVGIEFLEDESFRAYHKKSTYREITQAVDNIKAHGLRVRGLFILGADDHRPGVGRKLADYVIEHDIDGFLVQSMYFIPGTKVYASHKAQLLQPGVWEHTTGKVVHRPLHMSATQLQGEMIDSISRIYSLRRLAHAILRKRGLNRLLFMGEFLWMRSVRHNLRTDLKRLAELEKQRAENVLHEVVE